jgi:DMSO/TMAO reductase YedYZ heme-binding membrane subunit
VSIWIAIRAAGIGGYIALYLSVAWGLISTTGIVTKRIAKPSGNHFHAVIAATGLALVGVHLLLLTVHGFMPFSWLDLLVPAHAAYRPVAIAFGIVSMYAMIVVTASSWLRGRLSVKVWRAIHLLAVPTFVLALLHGVFAGTDTGRPWMLALYAGTGLSVVFLLLVRALTHGYRPPRPAAASRPAATPAAVEARAVEVEQG